MNQKSSQNPELPIEDRINAGYEKINQGQGQEALAIFERVLQEMPRQAYALIGLGLVSLNQGQADVALQFFQQSLTINSGIPECWYNMGNAYQSLSQLDKALEHYEHALQLKPEYLNCLMNIGNTYHLMDQGETALQYYHRALEIKPDFPDCLVNMGNVYKSQKQFDKAMQCYTKALALKPLHPDYLVNLGSVYQEMDLFNEALALYESALKQNPMHFEALLNMGNTHQLLDQADKALECYKKALLMQPRNSELLIYIGRCYVGLTQFEIALKCYQRALELTPDSSSCLMNLGNVFQALSRFDEAFEYYQKALALQPDYAECLMNIGNTHYSLGCLDQALEFYDRVLTLNPDHESCKFNLSLTQLTQGNFSEGWKNYDFRMAVRKFDYYVPFLKDTPLYEGQTSLEGKTVLVCAEQGLGDFIQFIRYVPLLTAKGTKVIVVPADKFTTLLSCFSFDVPRYKIGDDIDYWIPVMSLPRVFNTVLETIPQNIPYIVADPDKVRMMQHLIPSSDKKNIGIVWQGSKKHRKDRFRSTPIEKWSPILQLENVNIYSLQWGDESKDLKKLPSNLQSRVTDLSTHMHDFFDTAAIISHLDLIISIDTAMVHLAGAMNVPCWMLVTKVADWRWLLDREDSPWYPSMKIFRQEQAGNWEGVIQRVVDTLRTI